MLQIISIVVLSVASLLGESGERVVQPDEVAESAIDAVLSNFHKAATEADFESYFACLAENAIFFGTDAAERWTVAEFKAFAQPYFERGQGWTYDKRTRNIFVNAEGTAGWFDEVLENANYGFCRGTGVIVKTADGEWEISQYNLVIPVPNDFARQVVAANRTGVTKPQTIYVVRHVEKAAQPVTDPILSDEGIAHLDVLLRMLKDVNFTAVYATDYARTRLTAAPFMARDELETKLYNPRDQAKLVQNLRDAAEEPSAEELNTLVVGHSNTIPVLLRDLGITDEITIAETDYDNLFMVRIDELGRATLTRLHF